MGGFFNLFSQKAHHLGRVCTIHVHKTKIARESLWALLSILLNSSNTRTFVYGIEKIRLMTPLAKTMLQDSLVPRPSHPSFRLKLEWEGLGTRLLQGLLERCSCR